MTDTTLSMASASMKSWIWSTSETVQLILSERRGSGLIGIPLKSTVKLNIVAPPLSEAVPVYANLLCRQMIASAGRVRGLAF